MRSLCLFIFSLAQTFLFHAVKGPSIAAGIGLVYQFDLVGVEINFGIPLVAYKSSVGSKPAWNPYEYLKRLVHTTYVRYWRTLDSHRALHLPTQVTMRL